jgi:hypothetical protein
MPFLVSFLRALVAGDAVLLDEGPATALASRVSLLAGDCKLTYSLVV